MSKSSDGSRDLLTFQASDESYDPPTLCWSVKNYQVYKTGGGRQASRRTEATEVGSSLVDVHPFRIETLASRQKSGKRSTFYGGHVRFSLRNSQLIDTVSVTFGFK